MVNEKKALDYLTLSRGFAIAWIVISHSAIPSIRATDSFAWQFFLSMYAVALPMFMCLSGHLFEYGLEKYKRQGYSQFLKDKFHRLMIPYLFFLSLAYIFIAVGSTIPFVHSMLERFSFTPRGLYQAVVEIVTMDNIIAKHLWFCYTLFLIFAITYPLASFWKKWPGLAVAFVLYLIDMRYQDDLPYMVERVCQYMIFFQTGRWITSVEKHFRPALLPAYFLAAATFYIIYNKVDTRAVGFFGGALVYEVGISGSLVVFTLMRYLASSPVGRILHEMGAYSYDVYLIHQPVLTAGTTGLLWTFCPWMHPWAMIGVGAVVGFGGSYLISRFIIRPVPVLRRYLLGMKR